GRSLDEIGRIGRNAGFAAETKQVTGAMWLCFKKVLDDRLEALRVLERPRLAEGFLQAVLKGGDIDKVGHALDRYCYDAESDAGGQSPGRVKAHIGRLIK